MSIIIEVAASNFRLTESQRRRFEVEIFGDGWMEFLDYNIEDDEALAEFGYPDTDAMNLRGLWFSHPGTVIARHMDLPDKLLIDLANDYSSHVDYIARSYRSGLIPESLNHAHAAGMVEDAEHIALRAMNGKEPPGYSLEQIASLSAVSAAFYAAPGPYNQDHNEDKFNAAKKVEQDWQRRHFVELVEKFYGEEP
jgi:hypothetical protein